MSAFASAFCDMLAVTPLLTPRDAAKWCFQAACGCEHLLSDEIDAKARLLEEMRDAKPCGRLIQPLSSRFARISLGDWREEGLDAAWLFLLFAESAKRKGDAAALETYLETAGRLAAERGFFMTEEWDAFLESYDRGALSHSAAYRDALHPAYRVIDAVFLPLIPILRALRGMTGGVIAIDGRCASGKSTLASMLAALLSTEAIHMDDFFLPPCLRTEARLREAGGNVDYERFTAEVLPHLRTGEAFSYRIFDCSRMDFHGSRQINPNAFRIIEGSYSHHPVFGSYADLRIFLTVDPKEQADRIRARNGEEMAKVFADRWIPLEERYFTHFSIPATADLCLSTDSI